MTLKYSVLDDSTGKLKFVTGTQFVTQDPSITSVNAPAGTIIVWAASTGSKIYIKRSDGNNTDVAPLDISAFSGSNNSAWGWKNRGTPSFSLESGGTVARLTLGTDGTAVIGGRPIKIPAGNYDATTSGSAGQRFIYLDDSTGSFKISSSPWSLFSTVPTFTAFWNGTTFDNIGYEMHGLRDLWWHYYNHKHLGTQYTSGITATGNKQTDNNNNPPDSTVEYLWFTTGQIEDEDNWITVGSGLWNQTLGSGLTDTTAAILPFYYWNGTRMARLAPMADRTPFIHAGGNTTPQWNNNGTLTASVTGEYVVYHYYASVLVGGDCLIARPHNAVYGTLEAAKAADPSSLIWSGFPVDDAKYVYRAIFRVTTTWTGSTHRSKLVDLADRRTTPGTPIAASNANSHNALSGRADADSHPISAITGLDDALNNIYSMGAAVVTAEEGITELSLTSISLTVTATCLLEVLRNGQDLLEAADLDFTRDVGNNKILFNYTIPKGSKLKIKVYRG